MPVPLKIIYTIGHSTLALPEFIKILQSFSIQVLVDIRSYPGSRRYPHFNKENLQASLAEHGISYVHLSSLGGRRKTSVNSRNTAWKNESFRGYADYMESESFTKGISDLEKMGLKSKVAYMCSEAVWWRCHRSMVSDYLKVKRWTVMHIMNAENAQEHSYTSPAKVINKKLSYESSQKNFEF